MFENSSQNYEGKVAVADNPQRIRGPEDCETEAKTSQASGGQGQQKIVDWLDIKGIPYRVDKTNFEDRFFRNRIRLKLVITSFFLSEKGKMY